jgi:hypothetical protein
LSRFPADALPTAIPIASGALAWSVGIEVPPGRMAGVVPK